MRPRHRDDSGKQTWRDQRRRTAVTGAPSVHATLHRLAGMRRACPCRRPRRRARVPHGVPSRAMDFGFTLKPDHTIQRTIALTRQAEAAGFTYGWLFDSHVLWQEVYPLLTLMAINTQTDAPRDLRHQPCDARAERDRERAGHAGPHLRWPDGPRHRPRRQCPARAGQAAHDDEDPGGGDRAHPRPRGGAHPTGTRTPTCTCRGPAPGSCPSGSPATARWRSP